MKTSNRRAPQMLTVAELALALNLSTKTIRRHIGNGAIHIHRIGRQIRIAEDDAWAFVAARRR